MATVEPHWLDELLGGRIQIGRSADVYPPSIDAILLAASIASAPHQTVLDVGTGSGAASLALLARQRDCHITGIDTHEEALALAHASAEANGFAAQLTLQRCDIAAAARVLQGRQFDVVMTNPPFYAPETIRGSPDPARSAAHEESMPLAAWLAHALKRVRSHGWLHLIHRADRLDEVLASVHGQLGDLRILPIYARADLSPATRVLVAGRCGAKSPTRLLQGLVLHQADGRYTAAAEAVLRHAQPLNMTGQG
ncbi:MAG: methyltransferase [Pseudomonadota bacterium]